MTDETVVDELRVLAGNLASLWNGGLSVLDRLSGSAGDSADSPWSALKRLGPRDVEAIFGDVAGRDEVLRAFQSLTRYLASPTWFDRAASENERLAELRHKPIAYFCMEYGLVNWLAIYSGGLGVLAGDMLKEASDMGLPMVAVGLLYRHGFFRQRLDETQYQTEVIPTLNPDELPLETAVDRVGNEVVVCIPIEDRDVYAKAWKLQVGRVPLYLLDTDIEQNSRQQDRELTDSLYAGGAETRIQQEMILGIGGTRLLNKLGVEPSVYSLNEGHAAFLGLELVADFMQNGDFHTALERTRNRVVYTNHTVVAAGNDVFSCDLVRRFVGRYADQSGLGVDRVLEIACQTSSDQFSMAILAFQLSGKANAVSKLHAEIIPREWPGYAVEAVTNGVHVPTWLGPEITALLEEFVPDWRGDAPDWSAIRSIPDARLQHAHEAQRRAMIRFVNAAQSRARLREDVLTIVWARRFAEYKRAWLIAEDMARLSRLLSSTDRPVQLVIAGKAHPRDEGGKQMLQSLLRRLYEDNTVAPRVAFVEDYEVCVARYLTAGGDVWLNTPRKPLEASGTSGMKSSDNGGLQLTVTDGWAAEVDWWGTGWGIDGRDDAADSRQLMDFLETSVVPTFYDLDEDGVAGTWAAMMKNTMIATLSDFSARRMLLDYLNTLYLPLLGEQCERSLPQL